MPQKTTFLEFKKALKITLLPPRASGCTHTHIHTRAICPSESQPQPEMNIG